ncbi:MAG: TolC family protein [Verrucomicrobiota bacterium]
MAVLSCGAPCYAFDDIPSYDLSIADGAEEKPLSLKQAISKALYSNLEIQIEAVSPQIVAHQGQQNEGVFDPSFEGSLRYDKLETPQSSQEFVSTGGTRFSNGRLFGTNRVFAEDNVESRASIVGRLPAGTEYDVGIRANRFENDLTRDPTVSIFSPEYRTFTGVTFKQPLMRDFGKEVKYSKIYVSRIDKRIADHEFKGKVGAVLLQTIDAYYQTYIALKDLEAKRYEVEVLTKISTETLEQWELGGTAEKDFAAVKSSLAESYERFLLSRQTFLTRNGDLLGLIQEDFSFEDSPVYMTTDSPSESVPDLDPYKLTAKAMKHRPEYLIALEEVEKLGIILRYRENQMMPRVDLDATVGHTSLAGDIGRSFQNSLERQGYEYGVGVSVSVPFANVEKEAQHSETEAMRRQAVLNVKRAELQTQLAIQRHLTAIKTHRRRLEAAKMSIDLEQKSLDRAEENRELGGVTEITVLQIEKSIRNTRIRQYAAAADLQRSLAELRLSSGVLLSHYDVELMDGDTFEPAGITPGAITDHYTAVPLANPISLGELGDTQFVTSAETVPAAAKPKLKDLIAQKLSTTKEEKASARLGVSKASATARKIPVLSKSQARSKPIGSVEAVPPRGAIFKKRS